MQNNHVWACKIMFKLNSIEVTSFLLRMIFEKEKGYFSVYWKLSGIKYIIRCAGGIALTVVAASSIHA